MQPHERVLTLLVDRLATLSRPLNAQDSVLIVRALSSLRVRSPHVRTVCEKAAFTLASTPKQELPVAVVVDIVNHLASLQAASTPVVQKVLTKRFEELDAAHCPTGRTEVEARVASLQKSSTAQTHAVPSPQTVQKAAVALAKMGRPYAPAQVCDAVLHSLHKCLSRESSDIVLQLAYIALFPYTTIAHAKRLTDKRGGVRLAVQRLVRCLDCVFAESSGVRSLKGNSAWQALHAYVAVVVIDRQLADSGDLGEPARSFQAKWKSTRERVMLRAACFSRLPFARCADLVRDFSPELSWSPEAFSGLLFFMLQESEFASATQYDIAKLTSAVGGAHVRGDLSALDAVTKTLLTLSVERMASLQCDLFTVAACWHLAPRANRTHESSTLEKTSATDDSVAAQLCEYTIEALHAASTRAGEAEQTLPLTAATHVCWIAFSLGRTVSAGAYVAHVAPVADALLTALVSSDCLDQLPARSLAQLWLALGWLCPSCPVAVYVPLVSVKVGQLLAKATLSASEAEMLLDGSTRILRHLRASGETSAEDCVKCVLPVARDSVSNCVRLARSQHRALLSSDEHRDHVRSLAYCISTVEQSGVARLSEEKDYLCACLLDTPGVDPTTVFHVLSQISDSQSTPARLDSLIDLASRLSRTRWTDASAATNSGVELRRWQWRDLLDCAGAYVHMGKPVSFNERVTGAFCVPVNTLVSDASCTPTDAAHCLVVLSTCILRTKALPVDAAALLERLVDKALAPESDRQERSVARLVLLLQANRHLFVSNILFTKSQLCTLMSQVESKLCDLDRSAHADGHREQRVDRSVVRLVRALLRSQVFYRLGGHALTRKEASEQAILRACENLDTRRPEDKELVLTAHLLFAVEAPVVPVAEAVTNT